MIAPRPFTPWFGDIDPPVPGETRVELLLRCGRETGAYLASKFIWRHRDQPGDIVGWRMAGAS